MTKYVAFLRGINSGTNSMKMEELRNVFEEIGFNDVRSVISSGNIIFDASQSRESVLEQNLEKALHTRFGFEIMVIVRSMKDIQKIYDTKPFQKIMRSQKTIPYLTFLKKDSKMPLFPSYPINGEGYSIIGVFNRVIFSIVDLSGGATPDLMKVFDKKFKKAITTRNWRTIERILAK